MNNYPGLTWEFNPPSDTVDFMDLTITIKNGKISTSLFEKPLNLHLYIPPPTLPTPQGSSRVLYTVRYSEFSPYVLILMTKYFEPRCFLNDYKHEATKATKSNHSSWKLSPVQNSILDQMTQQTMIILRSYSTSLTTQMTLLHTKSNRHGDKQSHPPNTTCPYLTCATQNQKKNATFSVWSLLTVVLWI